MDKNEQTTNESHGGQHDSLSATDAPKPTPEQERARSTLSTDRDFGDWLLLEELGRGRNGVVYKALERKRHRVVAIKRIPLDPSSGGSDVAALARVARSDRRLHHRHIPEVHDAGQRGNEYFLATAFAGGKSLRATLETSGPLPATRASELFMRLAITIDYAHRHGVVHGDLKPANVIVDERGSPTVTDFALTRELETREGAPSMVDGTPADELAYASPERLGASESAIPDSAALVPASDVYSLGAMLYEAVSGRRPFEGEPARIVAAIREQPPAPLAGGEHAVDPRLAAICMKALAKRPEDRYASMDELAKALRGWSDPIAGPADGRAAIFGEAPMGSSAASRRRGRLEGLLESRLFAPLAGGALAIATIAAVAFFFSLGGVNFYYSFDGPGVRKPALGDKPARDPRLAPVRRGNAK